MPKTIIYRLSKSLDDKVLTTQSRPAKLLRLQSLQTDPTHFYSKYDVEVKYEEELWLSRLREPHVQHFVPLIVDDERDEHDESQEIVLDDCATFHGMLVIINEYEKELTAKSTDETESDDIIPAYFLGYLYIDASLRSQGLGTKLMQRSIEWIRNDAKNKGWPSVKYRTTAMKGNDGAVKLYLRNGFEIEAVEKRGSGVDNIFTELSMMIRA